MKDAKGNRPASRVWIIIGLHNFLRKPPTHYDISILTLKQRGRGKYILHRVNMVLINEGAKTSRQRIFRTRIVPAVCGINKNAKCLGSPQRRRTYIVFTRNVCLE